ncbi:TraX family protein [Halomonas borealis]|uniref:TraX family protein n=1 Tax=Halomonas borealis TaxID=2508710 RepID=UPI00109F8678|nr:TraX family protein [Halomonas borealis]
MPLADAATPDTAARPSSNWAGWGQWLALITMTLDHLARYAFPEAWGLGWIDSSLGRIAFPLFAGMVAWHGLFNTRDPLRYARRVLVIGLVAQLPYALMPRDIDGLILNICFTLSLGLIGGAWLLNLPPRLAKGLAAWRTAAESLAVLGVWALAGSVVEYGHLGLLLIPFYMLAMQRLHLSAGASAGWRTAALATLPLLLAAGLMNSSEMAKSVTVATCLTVLCLAAGAHRLPSKVPFAMPRRLWLAWYPAHFAAIALWLGLS